MGRVSPLPQNLRMLTVIQAQEIPVFPLGIDAKPAPSVVNPVGLSLPGLERCRAQIPLSWIQDAAIPELSSGDP